MKPLLIVAALGASLGGSVAEEKDQLWSLSPIRHEQPPTSEAGWQRNAIDAYFGDDAPSRAERRALIRRASYNLTGLPPTADAVEEFVADPRPDTDAFAAVVEALLASEHYGEHWARHWLDIARYADTAGENSDHPLPHAWRYRNWVIDAFNADKPYDRFVQEQLAGDILAQGDSLVGTGYLAIARRFGHDIEKSMHLTYEDVIDNIGKAFLGLSISCARCHDHKHDPIPTRDYYALYGILESTTFSYPGCEPNQQPRDLVPLASAELLAKREKWEKKREALEARLAPAIKQEIRDAKALHELARTNEKIISEGTVPDAGSILVTAEPIEVQVRAGEAIQLSILPRGNHGADTTVVDFSITCAGKTWSVADLIDSLGKGNPHKNWCFLDTSGDPRLLPEQNDSTDGRSELKSWRNGDTPSVFVNTSNDPITVWTTLPPRTFFVHPGPKGPVSLAWLSPIDGSVSIHLKVSDGHPGGDGVAWRLEHFGSTEISAAYRNLGKVVARHQAIARHATSAPVFPVAYAVSEGTPRATRLQLRGDPEDLGEEVNRTFLSALGGGDLGDGDSSGRLDLAKRITSRDNPLTARVMANRIWAWHFGTGIVATPNDFGNHGARPTKPELLDYLARRFMDEGWSIKAMHRLIMNSATYQQATGENSILPRRRITAEELRDTLLVASGELDTEPGEGHPFPPESSWNFTQHNPFAAEYPNRKRSIYQMRKRNRTESFLALFDAADPNASTAGRDVTTIPTQALYFMNDPFFHSCAEKFSTRICGHSTETKSRIDFACRQLFARPATAEELATFEEFSAAMAAPERETWSAYARILLGSNELMHLD